DLWVSADDQRYGLPKDWDTVAIFYNKQMLADAGVDEAELQDLTWNPQDGGSYEDLIARLTVDEKGTRGDEPGFDKDNVAVYGLGLENSGGPIGQTQWSMYAGTTGWTSTDQPTWGTQYNYDDPRFQETIAWWRSLIEKGYMPTLEAATAGVSVSDAYAAGKAALNTNGSWMIGTYVGYDGIETGVAPTPTGPNGTRASMFNGLADSIYAGTDNQEGAWEWVKFLGSAECQSLVAEKAVVFPALPGPLEEAVSNFEANGVEVSAFTTHVEEETTFLYPITEHAADVEAILAPMMDAIVAGKEDATVLTKANEQVNALFQ
ncbi:MAG: extracellular solute-binding protein, partial [Microthrixaceae bacterium]